MAKRILICGHDLHGYHRSMADGFAAEGWDVSCFAHPNVTVRKLERGNWLRRRFAAAALRRINDDLLTLAARYRPDLTLCINAEALLPETIRALTAGRPAIVWLVDALANIRQSREALALFSRVVVFEPTDLAALPGAVYLPYGADVARYRPLHCPKTHDVTFVGADHAGRLPVLEAVAGFCRENGWSFGVFGPFRSFQRLFRGARVRREFPALAQSLRLNRALAPAEVNQVYNASRISLNIHHEQSAEGINPRTFEIPASGGFELVDRKASLNRFLTEGKDVACYTGLAELKEQIRHYLKHAAEREAIAAAGLERVRDMHTFRQRCRALLESVAG